MAGKKGSLDPKRAALMGRVGAQVRLVNTTRQERSQAARRGWEDAWMRKADPDGKLSVAERARKAEALQKAHMARMTLARWGNRPATPQTKQKKAS